MADAPMMLMMLFTFDLITHTHTSQRRILDASQKRSFAHRGAMKKKSEREREDLQLKLDWQRLA